MGIHGDRSQGARRNDVGRSRRHQQAFCQPAPLAFLGQPHQPVRLQRVQMVVDLLASQADPRGQRRRRGGRGQLGEESASHRLQGYGRRRRIIDDLDVEHEEIVSLTTFIVKRDPRVVSAGRAARATIKIAQIRAAHAELPSADLTARVEELESTVAGLRPANGSARTRRFRRAAACRSAAGANPQLIRILDSVALGDVQH